MSIMPFSRDRSGPQRVEPQPAPLPFAPRPRPAPPGPHQLGNTTLANVETLTNMSADEIEKLADAVDTAAHETSDNLRHFAHKLRSAGSLANSELAAFVHVASLCAETGKHMQAAIEKRNEPPSEPPAATKADGTAAVPVDLDAIEQAVGDVMAKSGAADVP